MVIDGDLSANAWDTVCRLKLSSLNILQQVSNNIFMCMKHEEPINQHPVIFYISSSKLFFHLKTHYQFNGFVFFFFNFLPRGIHDGNEHLKNKKHGLKIPLSYQEWQLQVTGSAPYKSLQDYFNSDYMATL